MHLRTAFLFAVTLTVGSLAAVVEPVDAKENPLTEKNEPRSSPTEIPPLADPLPAKPAGEAPLPANPSWSSSP